MTKDHHPKHIALATDLTHRCDRALDRALLLTRAWQAELHVIHALTAPADPAGYSRFEELPSWRMQDDPVNAVRDRISRDLVQEDPDAQIAVHVDTGSPAEVVLAAATHADADLIVTGVARDGLFSRLLLGNTVERLMRKSAIPILIVRDRAFAPYQSMVVATDFSPSSRVALESAARLFPDAGVTLFNAYDIPFAGYLNRFDVEKEFADFGSNAADKFLAEADIPDASRQTVVHMIQQGVPEALLRDFAEKSQRHLTVVGTHGGGVVYDTVIGSTARKIIDAVPGDVLLVPDPARRKG